jgi:hypothetical protein
MKYAKALLVVVALTPLTSRAVPTPVACRPFTLSGAYVFSVAATGPDKNPKTGNIKQNVPFAMSGVWIFVPPPHAISTPAVTHVPPAGQPISSAGTVFRYFTLFNGGPNASGVASDGDTPATPLLTDAGDSGTYSENDSFCSAQVTFPNTPIGTETYTLYFTRSAKTVYFINTTSEVVMSGRLEAQ